jgi:hypothetical protein
MNQTLKVSLAIGQPVRRDGFACRDEGQRAKPLGSRMVVVNALRESQVKGGEELRPFYWWTLMPSVLDRAFKGEL